MKSPFPLFFQVVSIQVLSSWIRNEHVESSCIQIVVWCESHGILTIVLKCKKTPLQTNPKLNYVYMYVYVYSPTQVIHEWISSMLVKPHQFKSMLWPVSILCHMAKWFMNEPFSLVIIYQINHGLWKHPWVWQSCSHALFFANGRLNQNISDDMILV